jgi:hypothetical protein
VRCGHRHVFLQRIIIVIPIIVFLAHLDLEFVRRVGILPVAVGRRISSGHGGNCRKEE